MSSETPIAIAETAHFAMASRKMLNDTERDELTDFLAWNPVVGDVIAGTGGVRKVRWALKRRGKSGGARVIYYFHDERIPLYLLDIYEERSSLFITG
jgi:mRNA-degrading endonuclease RelE of RelBE toxin-antitoxin system